MIPLCVPNLTGKENEYVTEALKSGFVSGGQFIERFEFLIAEACDTSWAIAVQSGTSALHLCLSIGLLDPTKMPAMTFGAAASMVTQLGSTPHFEDIPKEGWSPDMSWVGSVRDAAAAISEVKYYDDRLTCLSFNANKVITTGQGGAIVGNDPDLHLRLRHKAKTAKIDDYIFTEPGFNYMMSNVTAAIGCAQIERLVAFQQRKDKIIDLYSAAGLDMIPSRWMAIWKTEDRDNKIKSLQESGIAAQAFWTPLQYSPAYENCPSDPLPNTEEIWNKLIMIPCSTSLTETEQERVIESCLLLLPDEQMQAHSGT